MNRNSKQRGESTKRQTSPKTQSVKKNPRGHNKFDLKKQPKEPMQIELAQYRNNGKYCE